MISSCKDMLVVSPLRQFFQRPVELRSNGRLAMHLEGAHSIVLQSWLCFSFYLSKSLLLQGGFQPCNLNCVISKQWIYFRVDFLWEYEAGIDVLIHQVQSSALSAVPGSHIMFSFNNSLSAILRLDILYVRRLSKNSC